MWINYQFMAVCPLILNFSHISSQKWLVFGNYFGLSTFLPQLANFFTRIYPSYPLHFPTLCTVRPEIVLIWKEVRHRTSGQFSGLEGTERLSCSDGRQNRSKWRGFGEVRRLSSGQKLRSGQGEGVPVCHIFQP